MPESGVLRVVHGGNSLVFAPGEEVVIGRHPDADVHIANRRVSRRHAIVAHHDGHWVLEDQESSNGTFVLGEPITKLPLVGPVKINVGDADGPSITLIPTALETAEPPGDATVTVGHETLETHSAPAVPEETASLRSAYRITRIGRADDNDIVLDDQLVSSYHAEVRGSESIGFEIVDLNSRNGTMVNGNPIERQELRQFDLVTIGRHMLRLIGEELQREGRTG